MKYEVDFLPVGDGSGDAIVMCYGDDTNGYFLHVVDGGRAGTAETIISHINQYYPGYHINHMVLSHADVLGDRPLLLTADVGPIGLTEAADFGHQLGLAMPKCVQVPHHGSRHNVTPAVLDRWLGPKQPQGTQVGYAICSVGANKPDYPRGQVKNAFMRRGFKVYSTRTQRVTHYGGGGGHPNMVPAVAEEFAHQVEGL